MYIVGLISLFAWNAVFGAFGSLLLCIHQDVDSREHASASSSCANEHGVMVVTDACPGEDDACVDIALLAEPLPLARLQFESFSLEPLVLLAVLFEHFQLTEPSLDLVYQSAQWTVPKQSCWLTDSYLQTTVLRV